MNCSYISRPAASISWYTQSGDLIRRVDNTLAANQSVSDDMQSDDSDDRRVVSQQQSVDSNGYTLTASSLTIINVTWADRMTYRCVASNGISTTTSQLNQDLDNKEQSTYSATATVSANILCKLYEV